ncbi:MAG: hypothetical protein QXY90_02055 [Candidatus Anstonellales archaeon]
MEDETVVITAQDIASHSVYLRKKNELSFQLEFLRKQGSSEEDFHIKALLNQLKLVEEKLEPVEKRLRMVDLVMISPKKEIIDQLTEEINAYTQEERYMAMIQKRGPLYEKMKQRASLARRNYENREEIARLILLVNSLQREEAEGIKRMAELEGEESVDLSNVEDDKKLEILVLLNRIGIPAVVVGNKLVRSSEEDKSEVERLVEKEKKVWIRKEKAAEFDRNERLIEEANKKLQKLNAIRQIRQLEDKEYDEFVKAQNDYLEGIERRKEFLNEAKKGLSKIEMKRIERKVDAVISEIAKERDLNSMEKNTFIKNEIKAAITDILLDKESTSEDKEGE